MIQLPRLRRGTKPYRDAVALARTLVHERLAHWSQVYNIPYGKVAIRKQKTRWGSASRNGNLNFNYRILFIPIREADYIIVHELCHLQEHNHSQAFWALVSRAFPDYRALRSKMRRSYRF
jgi:predicted metal-dependent hydrolase